MTSEEQYRHTLFEHGRAIHAALEATTDHVRAFIQRRHLRLDLYPLDFTQQLIADSEQLGRDAAAALARAEPEE